MIPYSVHVAIILAVCWGFYQLLLRKETYYRLNRIVLIGSLMLAFVLPLIPLPEQYSLRQDLNVSMSTSDFEEKDISKVSDAHSESNVDNSVTILPSEAPQSATPVMSRIINWISWFYWFGVAIFAVNLVVQFISIFYQSYRRPVIKDGVFRIVEMEGDKAPCSFGNTIFINPEKYDWETYNQILIHEKIHIQQGHSIDLIFAELMLVLQWFNPFAWMHRKALESNLEFLVDDSLVRDHKVEIESYQLSLLKVAVPNQSMNITTNYNQSLLKRRMLMMNAKKSNVHSTWKYFVILPVMVLMFCGLNKPVAMSNAIDDEAFTKIPAMAMSQSKGLWFATVKEKHVQVEFKSDDYIDRNYRWTNSATFGVNEFSSLPQNNKDDFKVVREAGIITFNGKFDGDQGFGRFKFTPNKEYKAFLAFKGIDHLKDEEYVSFFIMDVTRKYVQFLNDNGFRNLSKNQIISMAAFKIDASYISYWKSLGYKDITPNNLISLKSLKIDSAYVNDIRRSGYEDLSIQQLISFKSQKITGSYISSLRKATLKKATNGGTLSTPVQKPSANEILQSKALKVDTTYVAAVRDAGFQDLSPQTVSSMKSQNITPDFILSFQDVGMKDLSASTLQNLKSKGITAEFVKSYQEIGMNNLSVSTLSNLKTQGITAEFIKSYQEIGMRDLPISTLQALRAKGLTPSFIKSYQEIGMRDLSINTLQTLKKQGLTPSFIKGYQEIGMRNLPINTLNTIRQQGLSPAFIKGFQDIGLRDAPLNVLYSFKTQGITPDFIKGFQNLGYRNIPYNLYATLKSKGITADYVSDMKAKGFDSKDVTKYIQLKSFNGANK